VTRAVLERRRRERQERLALARRYADALAERLPVTAVVVFGSVARGDFNAWSDIDVLVIADTLPAGGRERLELLHDRAFPGVQPVGWTPAELADRARHRDPIAVEATAAGVTVHGTLPAPP
jgi:uncharacterized protein